MRGLTLTLTLTLTLALVLVLALAQAAEGVRVSHRTGAPLGFRATGRKIDPRTQTSFRIHLVRKQSMEELDAALLAVSSPGSPAAGRHLSYEETEALFEAVDGAAERVLAWLADAPVAVTVRSDHIHVRCTVDTLETLLDTAVAEWVSIADILALGEEDAPRQLAAAAPAHIPDALVDVVEHVTGVSELFHMAHPQRSRASRVASFGHAAGSGLGAGPADKISYHGKDTQVSPALLRDWYGIDYKPTGTSAKQCVGSIGQYYNPTCLAEFAETWDDASYGVIAKSVGYNCWGIQSNATCAAAQLEADLDVDYMTSMGSGLETWVWNAYPDEEHTQEWMMAWATQVTGQTGSGDETPQVYSLSYGFPEVWECATDIVNMTQYCPTFGYDSAKYIAAVDAEFMKMGMRGWSVMVATGDDGAAGDSSNMPYALGFEDNVVNGLYVSVTGPASTDVAADGATETFTCSIPIGGMGRGFICGMVASVCPSAIDEFKTATFATDAGCTLKTTSVFGPSCTSAAPSVSSNCSIAEFPTKTWTSPLSSQITCSIGAYDPSMAVAAGVGLDGPLNSQYPSASPYVTGVGATMLTCPGEPTCTGPNTEVTCSAETGAVITSAGFFSPYHKVPSWQADVTAKYLADNADALPPKEVFGQNARGSPDVAFLGHNYVVGAYTGDSCGSMYGIDGTSASSPSFAGLVSLINDARYNAGKSSIGYLNPYLYSAPAGVFTDITEGSNHARQATPSMIYDPTCNLTDAMWAVSSAWGYPAAEGWDAATGLGAPVFDQLMAYLLSQS